MISSWPARGSGAHRLGLYVRARDRPYPHVPVWMTGVIRTQAHPNDAGDPGYTMQATIIGPYRDPA